MMRFLAIAAILTLIGAVAYLNRRVATPEEFEFGKRFNREAVLMKTCGFDPSTGSGAPMKVYRFEDALWFDDRSRWRRIDAKVENVCDLLDIDTAHRPPPKETPPAKSIG